MSSGNSGSASKVASMASLFQTSREKPKISQETMKVNVRRTQSRSDRFSKARAKFQQQPTSSRSSSSPPGGDSIRKLTENTWSSMSYPSPTEKENGKSATLGAVPKSDNIETYLHKWKSPTCRNENERYNQWSPPSPVFSKSSFLTPSCKPVARVTPVNTAGKEISREEDSNPNIILESVRPKPIGVNAIDANSKPNPCMNMQTKVEVSTDEHGDLAKNRLTSEDSSANEEVDIEIPDQPDENVTINLLDITSMNSGDFTRYEQQFDDLMENTDYSLDNVSSNKDDSKGDVPFESRNIFTNVDTENVTSRKDKTEDNLQDAEIEVVKQNINLPNEQFSTCDPSESKSQENSSIGSSLVGESLTSWLGQTSDSVTSNLPYRASVITTYPKCSPEAKSKSAPSPREDPAEGLYDPVTGLHHLPDGHFWFETSPLNVRVEQDNVPFKKPSRLSFSTEPIRQFSTYSMTDYDRTNDWIDPVTASAEWEVEKQLEALKIVEVDLDGGSSGSIGISVIGMEMGTVDEEGGSEKLGIFVKAIIAGKPAEIDGRVMVTDQILKVNGISLVQVTQSTAASVISNLSGVVRLELGRSRDPDNCAVALLIRQQSDAAIDDQVSGSEDDDTELDQQDNWEDRLSSPGPSSMPSDGEAEPLSSSSQSECVSCTPEPDLECVCCTSAPDEECVVCTLESDMECVGSTPEPELECVSSTLELDLECVRSTPEPDLDRARMVIRRLLIEGETLHTHCMASGHLSTLKTKFGSEIMKDFPDFSRILDEVTSTLDLDKSVPRREYLLPCPGGLHRMNLARARRNSKLGTAVLSFVNRISIAELSLVKDIN